MTTQTIRSAIITGSGERHFCTGTDVGNVAATGKINAGNGPASHELWWSPHQNRVWNPASVREGLVAGGGLHFVVDSDIVLAAENAAFMDTHVNVGMVGGIENVGLAGASRSARRCA